MIFFYGCEMGRKNPNHKDGRNQNTSPSNQAYTSEIISPQYSVGGGTIQGHKNPLGSMLTWPHFQYTKADTDYKECYCTFHVSVSLPGFPENPLRIILKKLPLNFCGPHKYKVLCRYVTFFLLLSWTFIWCLCSLHTY